MANQQGWSQQTPAIKALLGGAVRVGRVKARIGVSTRSKKRKKTASSSSTKRKTKKRTKKATKLKKGSAAAKAYMAKIRKMRK